MNQRLSPFSALLVGSIVLLIAAPLHAAQARQTYTGSYSVIESHNVFVKDRAHIVLGGPTSRPNGENSSRRSPEETFVVTGIVAEDGGYRAYVENIETSNVARVGVGDPLHKGRVGAIETDAIAYDPSGGGQRIWVEVGSDLTGKPSAALSARAAEDATSSGPGIASDIANINPNDPNLTVEQKMKLRRAQQMGTPIPAPGAAPAAPGAATQPAGAPPNANPQQQQQQQQQPAPAPPAPPPVIVIPPEGFQTGGPQ